MANELFLLLAWCAATLSSVVVSGLQQQQSHSILAATYGLAGCIGVDTSDLDALRRKGCLVTSNGKTSATSVLQTRAFCGMQSFRKTPTNADALPVTFSAPLQPSTVKPEFFEFTLNNGNKTHAICANAIPANEKNEMQTFATAGYYGDGWKDTIYPVRVTIVGHMLFSDGSSAKGLSFVIPHEQRFATGFPVIVAASLMKFSAEGEGKKSFMKRDIYPNHCQKLYPSTTHRIRVVLNGGSTLDGVHPVLPNQTELFHVLNSTGTRITAPVLGLADLGSLPAEGQTSLTYRHDGDNFYDICLDSSKGGIGSITHVSMPCDTVRLVLPKGKPMCSASSIPVMVDEVG